MAMKSQNANTDEETLLRQNAYMNALQETSLGLMQRRDVDSLLEDIVARAGALVGTENGFVFLSDPDFQEMELRVGVGAYEGFVGRRTKRGVGLAGQVWEKNIPVVVDDYREWDGRLADTSRDILRAVTGVPLRSGQSVIGVIGLAYLDETRKFAEPEITSAQRFADWRRLHWITRDRTRLPKRNLSKAPWEKEMRQRNKELETISRMSIVMTQEIDTVTALETMARELVSTFRARHLWDCTFDPDKRSLTVVADALSEGHEEYAVGIVIPVENNPSTQYVLENRRSLVIANAQTDPMTKQFMTGCDNAKRNASPLFRCFRAVT